MNYFVVNPFTVGKSFVLGELSFTRMPSRQHCLRGNRIHCYNWWPELVKCSQWQPYGVVSQHGMGQILGHPKLLQNLNAPHICRNWTFLETQILGNPCWVTAPHGCHWLKWTNFGKQLQNWILFIFIQLQLKDIVAKESSPRTNDLNHILGRITEISTSFEFGYPLLYVPISDSWHFVNINLNA